MVSSEALLSDNVVRTPTKSSSQAKSARLESSPAFSLASTVVTPPGRPAPSLPLGSQSESSHLARCLFNENKRNSVPQSIAPIRAKPQAATFHGRKKAQLSSSAPSGVQTQTKRPQCSAEKPAMVAPGNKAVAAAGSSVAKVGLSGAWQAQEEARQKSLAVAAAAEATAQEHARETAQSKQALEDLSAKHRVALLSLGEARESSADARRTQQQALGYAAASAAACTANDKARTVAEEAQAVLATKVNVLEATCASLQKRDAATHARLAQEQADHAELRALFLQEQRRNAQLTQAARKQDEHVRLLKHVQAQKEKHIATLLKDQRRLQDTVKNLQEAAMVARRHRASQQQQQQQEQQQKEADRGSGSEVATPKNRDGFKEKALVGTVRTALSKGSSASSALDLSSTPVNDAVPHKAVASADAPDEVNEEGRAAVESVVSHVTDGADASASITLSKCANPFGETVVCSPWLPDYNNSSCSSDPHELLSSPSPPVSSNDPTPLATQLLVGQLKQAKQAVLDALKERDAALRDRDQALARAQAFGVQLRNHKATQRRSNTRAPPIQAGD